MLATAAQHIIDHLHGLEVQPVLDKTRACNVIAGLIVLIEQYGRDLEIALADHPSANAEMEAEAAVARHRNLSEMTHELGHLILDDPLLPDKIGLLRVAFASFVDRAAAALATRKSPHSLK